MATKTLYLTGTTGDGWRTLSETAQAAVTNVDGWVVGTGATLHSEYQVGVERATFSGTTVPDGTLDTTLKDAFRAGPLNGTFAAGNWTFTFAVRAVTSAGTQNGRVRFRLIKANADGSSATEITAAQQQGSLTGAIANTTADFTSSLTLNPGAMTLTNQYLFIQIAWERTVAGSMSSSDVNWRTGSSASVGTCIVTTDFVPSQNITASPVASATVADVYATTNRSADLGMALGAARAQSFLGTGAWLTGCRFYLTHTGGADTGAIVGQIYAASGTHGTNAIPSGAVLATSELVDLSTVPTSPTYVFQPFVFAGVNQLFLGLGTLYTAGLQLTNSSEIGTLWVGADATTPTHAGNASSFLPPWTAQTHDLIFQVDTLSLGGASLFVPTITPAGGAGAQAVTTSALASTAVVRVPTLAYAVVTPGLTLSDSYAFSNANTQITVYQDAGCGQSVIGDGQTLDSARGSLFAAVGLTGTLTANVYAATGTHGTDARPTGTALAVSASLDLSTMAPGEHTFVFIGANQIRLSLGVTYVVTFEAAVAGSGSWFVRLDTVSPTHGGNAVVGSDLSIYGAPLAWSADPTSDVVFQVWTRPDVQVFAPVVTPAAAGDQAVTTVALAAGSTVTAPTVTPGAVTITSATLASSAGAFAPTLTPSVMSSAIISTATLFAPTVVPTQLITAATCIATPRLFAPTVTTAGALIGGTIAAGSVLFAPTLSGLVRARHFGYIMTTT